MIASEAVNLDFEDRLDKLSTALSGQANLLQKLQNVSVMLKGGGFTASGVILYATGGEAWVVTAKHNLWVRADEKAPPDWEDSLKDDFITNVKIYYDDPMTFGDSPGTSADLTDIEIVNSGSSFSWDYDVIILKSTDATMVAFATTNQLYDPTTFTFGERSYLYTASKYLNKTQRTSTHNFIKFIQTGYGKTTDTLGTIKKTRIPVETAGGNRFERLQYRFIQPKANSVTSVFDEREEEEGTYDEYKTAVQIDADANDSTWSGDSGGPLFIVVYDKSASSWKLYLIGITTGSDMATSEEECPSEGVLVENNIVTSLETCYQNYTI